MYRKLTVVFIMYNRDSIFHLQYRRIKLLQDNPQLPMTLGAVFSHLLLDFYNVSSK